MAKTITVNAVMEQLKMAGNEQSANRAVLRKCSEDFLEEMAEVVSQQSSCFFWRLPMKGRKKYYLDKLAQVRVEDLPIAKLERDKEACLSWLQGREGKGKFTNEWISYLQDQKLEEAVTMAQVFAVGQKFRIANRGEWEVVTRTKCFVTFSNGSATERCKVYMDNGLESVRIPRRDVLGRKDSVCAKDAIEMAQVRSDKVEEPAQTTTLSRATQKKIQEVQAAMTHDAIQAVLAKCTKARMLDVCREILGAEEHLRACPYRGTDNNLLASTYAHMILMKRFEDNFKARPFSEKYEILTNSRGLPNYWRYLRLLSIDELQAAARKLGLEGSGSSKRLCVEIVEELVALEQDSVMQEYARDKEYDELMHFIVHQMKPTTMKKLIERNGLQCADSKEAQEQAVYNYYTSKEYEPVQYQPCFTCINVEGDLKVVEVFPDAVCDPEQLSVQNDVVKFEVGKTYSGFRANGQPETYRIVARNEQWVYYRNQSYKGVLCGRITITTDKADRVSERLCTCGGGQVAHLSRYLYASSIEEAV